MGFQNGTAAGCFLGAVVLGVGASSLMGAEPDTALLDGVLYVLIPSHVRSPRRVKVLLNNFATNARIAQSRGIDWMARAREIRVSVSGSMGAM